MNVKVPQREASACAAHILVLPEVQRCDAVYATFQPVVDVSHQNTERVARMNRAMNGTAMLSSRG